MSDKQNSALDKVFTPTSAMQKWLDSSVKLMSTNKSEISSDCGVDRNNWYHWVKVPGFQDWFMSEYKRLRQVILPELDEIGMKMARRGQFDFWKEMNRKAGDTDSTPGVAIQVNNFLKKEKDEFGI